MKRYGMISAVGLLVLVNAVVLGGAAYNRSGEPDAVITMTERELPLSSYYGYADRENTGLSLRLTWAQGRSRSGRSVARSGADSPYPDWFDKARLEAVGFDCTMPLDDPRAEIQYDRMLPRKTYAVLEYEGKAWEAWQDQERDELASMEKKTSTGEVSLKQLTNARKEYEREARSRSRLFAVDVGNDPATLRRQYGDRTRFLVLPATVRISRYKHGSPGEDLGRQPWRLSGVITDILTDTIYVPKEHRVLLEKLLRSKERSDNYGPYAQRQRDPAYAAKLLVGKRHEPWIDSIMPLAVKPVQ